MKTENMRPRTAIVHVDELKNELLTSLLFYRDKHHSLDDSEIIRIHEFLCSRIIEPLEKQALQHRINRAKNGSVKTEQKARPSEWIDATDELPYENQNVLCWAIEYSKEPFLGFLDGGQWFDVELDEAVEHDVTHWIRLPSRPKLEVINEKLDS